MEIVVEGEGQSNSATVERWSSTDHVAARFSLPKQGDSGNHPQ